MLKDDNPFDIVAFHIVFQQIMKAVKRQNEIRFSFTQMY